MPALTLEQRVFRLEAILNLSAEADTAPLHRIITTVAACYGVKESDLRGRCREMEFVLPRQIYCYLGRRLRLSSTAVGNVINRDHGTVLHACACIEDRMDTNPEFLKRMRELAKINGVTLPERYGV